MKYSILKKKKPDSNSNSEKKSDNSVGQIAKKLSKSMSEFKDFEEYKKSLIEKINKREPGVKHNPFEKVRPESYIDNPLQFIPLDKVENIPTTVIVTKHGLEKFVELGVEPDAGAFHGARLGRQVDIPIAARVDRDGMFFITDGIHRAAQAVISGNDFILAFVEEGNGPNLKNIFDSVKKATK